MGASFHWIEEGENVIDFSPVGKAAKRGDWKRRFSCRCVDGQGGSWMKLLQWFDQKQWTTVELIASRLNNGLIWNRDRLEGKLNGLREWNEAEVYEFFGQTTGRLQQEMDHKGSTVAPRFVLKLARRFHETFVLNIWNSQIACDLNSEFTEYIWDLQIPFI